jgi:hypothetical protein
VLQRIVDLLEPWNSLYADSTLISTLVLMAHILALLFAGGIAITTDLWTLRAFRAVNVDRARVLADIASAHRPILIGLGVLFVSGVLMATADIETFVAAPAFWVKLTLVALLLINGALLMRVERGLAVPAADAALEGLMRRLRASAIRSLVLWTATAAAGVVLANAA